MSDSPYRIQLNETFFCYLIRELVKSPKNITRIQFINLMKQYQVSDKDQNIILKIDSYYLDDFFNTKKYTILECISHLIAYYYTKLIAGELKKKIPEIEFSYLYRYNIFPSMLIIDHIKNKNTYLRLEVKKQLNSFTLSDTIFMIQISNIIGIKEFKGDQILLLIKYIKKSLKIE